MEPIKIGQFIDTFVLGGAETIYLELCKGIRHYGFEPIALHFGNPYLLEECPRHHIKQYIVPKHSFYKSTTTLPVFAFHFANFLKSHGISLLHSHLFGPITGAALAACYARIPHIGTMHDVYMVEEKKSRIRLLQLAALCGTKLVTVSRHMLDYYKSSAWFPELSIRNIYNGIDVTLFTKTTREEARETLKIAPYESAIVTIGRLVSLKGFHILLEAFAKLSFPNLKLIIVGDGEERASLEELAIRLGIASRVQFLGLRHDIPVILAAADLFVLPSFSEGLSRSILEAMAAGLPCVVTDVGGNSELVIEGGTGIVIKSGDSATLSEGIAVLLTDSALHKKMGARSQQRAKEDFDLSLMLENYVACYRQALNLLS